MTADVIPESQCGFCSGRSTIDMIFSVHQLQEKCIEQNQDLYIVFVDLIKASDSMNRVALWQVMRKIGCPEKFINIVQSFHDGMNARVIDQGKLSEPFSITNKVKQGCVLAPTLFNIIFFALLSNAFSSNDRGIFIRCCTDVGLFNLRRFQAKTKVNVMLLHDFLFADDCALAAHMHLSTSSAWSTVSRKQQPASVSL